MSQHNQPNESVQPEDRNSTRIPQQHLEATPEAQPESQGIEEDSQWDEVEAEDTNESNSSDGSQEEQKPQLTKKERLLAKRAKLDLQIKREIEKERKERTHRLCLLAGTILKIEKEANTLTDLIVDRNNYDLTDEEINNFLYCMKEYKN